MLTTYTPEQEAAFSFAWLAAREPRWTSIDPHRLSFTAPGWDPLGQLGFVLWEGLRHLEIFPGNPAAFGFSAHTNADGSVNMQDARRKRNQWVIFLTPNRPDPGRPTRFAGAAQPSPIRCTR